MISTFDLLKSFRDEAKSKAIADGFIYASESANGESIELSDKTANYVHGYLLTGSESPVSLENQGSKISNGVYQIDVYTPLSNGKFTNIHKAELVKNYFLRGQHLERNGQKITVNKHEMLGNPMVSDGFYKNPVSIYYTVINK